MSMALLEPGLAVRKVRAISAKVPPSPWLLARITNKTYLRETTIVKAQNTIDITP